MYVIFLFIFAIKYLKCDCAVYNMWTKIVWLDIRNKTNNNYDADVIYVIEICVTMLVTSKYNNQ